MALQVSADAVRALIADGVYSLQILEQRDGQRVVLTFSLAARGGGYTIQIETSETKAAGLLQQLLPSTLRASQAKPPARATAKRRSRAEAAAAQRPMATPTVPVPPAGMPAKRQRRQRR
jgi:hypothetical protein